jgi:hypothetical protein
MRILPVLLFPIFVLNVIAQQEPFPKRLEKLFPGKDYKAKFDKFKGQTTITTELVWSRDAKGNKDLRAPLVSVAMIFNGEVPRKEAEFWLVFSSRSRGWTYLDDHRLIFLIDGERLDGPKGIHEGKVSTSRVSSPYSSGVGVNETVLFQLSPALMESLTKGTRVEYQLGNTESGFGSQTMTAIKDLASLTQ